VKRLYVPALLKQLALPMLRAYSGKMFSALMNVILFWGNMAERNHG
jgi:hypothetical protein